MNVFVAGATGVLGRRAVEHWLPEPVLADRSKLGPQELLLSVDAGAGKIREIDSSLDPDKLRYLRHQLAEQT